MERQQFPFAAASVANTSWREIDQRRPFRQSHLKRAWGLSRSAAGTLRPPPPRYATLAAQLPEIVQPGVGSVTRKQWMTSDKTRPLRTVFVELVRMLRENMRGLSEDSRDTARQYPWALFYLSDPTKVHVFKFAWSTIFAIATAYGAVEFSDPGGGGYDIMIADDDSSLGAWALRSCMGKIKLLQTLKATGERGFLEFLQNMLGVVDLDSTDIKAATNLRYETLDLQTLSQSMIADCVCCDLISTIALSMDPSEYKGLGSLEKRVTFSYLSMLDNVFVPPDQFAISSDFVDDALEVLADLAADRLEIKDSILIHLLQQSVHAYTYLKTHAARRDDGLTRSESGWVSKSIDFLEQVYIRGLVYAVHLRKLAYASSKLDRERLESLIARASTGELLIDSAQSAMKIELTTSHSEIYTSSTVRKAIASDTKKGAGDSVDSAKRELRVEEVATAWREISVSESGVDDILEEEEESLFSDATEEVEPEAREAPDNGPQRKISVASVEYEFGTDDGTPRDLLTDEALEVAMERAPIFVMRGKMDVFDLFSSQRQKADAAAQACPAWLYPRLFEHLALDANLQGFSGAVTDKISPIAWCVFLAYAKSQRIRSRATSLVHGYFLQLMRNVSESWGSMTRNVIYPAVQQLRMALAALVVTQVGSYSKVVWDGLSELRLSMDVLRGATRATELAEVLTVLAKCYIVLVDLQSELDVPIKSNRLSSPEDIEAAKRSASSSNAGEIYTALVSYILLAESQLDAAAYYISLLRAPGPMDAPSAWELLIPGPVQTILHLLLQDTLKDAPDTLYKSITYIYVLQSLLLKSLERVTGATGISTNLSYSNVLLRDLGAHWARMVPRFLLVDHWVHRPQLFAAVDMINTIVLLLITNKGVTSPVVEVLGRLADMLQTANTDPDDAGSLLKYRAGAVIYTLKKYGGALESASQKVKNAFSRLPDITLTDEQIADLESFDDDDDDGDDDDEEEMMEEDAEMDEAEEEEEERSVENETGTITGEDDDAMDIVVSDADDDGPRPATVSPFSDALSVIQQTVSFNMEPAPRPKSKQRVTPTLLTPAGQISVQSTPSAEKRYFTIEQFIKVYNDFIARTGYDAGRTTGVSSQTYKTMPPTAFEGLIETGDLKIAPGDCVVDLGAGVGLVMAYFAMRFGAIVRGIENTATNVSLVRDGRETVTVGTARVRTEEWCRAQLETHGLGLDWEMLTESFTAERLAESGYAAWKPSLFVAISDVFADELGYAMLSVIAKYMAKVPRESRPPVRVLSSAPVSFGRVRGDKGALGIFDGVARFQLTKTLTTKTDIPKGWGDHETVTWYIYDEVEAGSTKSTPVPAVSRPSESLSPVVRPLAPQSKKLTSSDPAPGPVGQPRKPATSPVPAAAPAQPDLGFEGVFTDNPDFATAFGAIAKRLVKAHKNSEGLIFLDGDADVKGFFALIGDSTRPLPLRDTSTAAARTREGFAKFMPLFRKHAIDTLYEQMVSAVILLSGFAPAITKARTFIKKLDPEKNGESAAAADAIDAMNKIIIKGEANYDSAYSKISELPKNHRDAAKPLFESRLNFIYAVIYAVSYVLGFDQDNRLTASLLRSKLRPPNPDRRTVFTAVLQYLVTLYPKVTKGQKFLDDEAAKKQTAKIRDRFAGKRPADDPMDVESASSANNSPVRLVPPPKEIGKGQPARDLDPSRTLSPTSSSGNGPARHVVVLFTGVNASKDSAVERIISVERKLANPRPLDVLVVTYGGLSSETRNDMEKRLRSSSTGVTVYSFLDEEKFLARLKELAPQCVLPVTVFYEALQPDEQLHIYAAMGEFWSKVGSLQHLNHKAGPVPAAGTVSTNDIGFAWNGFFLAKKTQDDYKNIEFYNVKQPSISRK